MFTIYHSNQFNVLTYLSAEIISRKPQRNPFKNEFFLVQNKKITEFIQIELADYLGISANIKFYSFNNFFWSLVNELSSCSLNKDLFSQPVMVWRLMNLLPRMSKHPAFFVINNYLFQDNKIQHKCFQLSCKIANLFKQYLIYRPNWLIQWQNKQQVRGLGKEQYWQSILWRSLVAETIKNKYVDVYNYINIYKILISLINKNKKKIINLPNRIFVYSVTTVSPNDMFVFQILSQYIDIYMLFFNPYYCKNLYSNQCFKKYFNIDRLNSLQNNILQNNPLLNNNNCYKNNDLYKKKINNSLLFSLGKICQENIHILLQLKDIIFVNACVNPVGKSLLKEIQRDILMIKSDSINLKRIDFNNLKHNNCKRLLKLDDQSITLHSCYSIYREVEVLHDHILIMMKKDNSLCFRDFIIMVTDIDKYIPAIKSIFGNSLENNSLPCVIYDAINIPLHPAVKTFFDLLKLSQSRFTVQEVLSILEITYIADKFAISKQELKILKEWVVNSGIRWGLDDDMLNYLNFPTPGRHTWEFGIMRMFLGYAMDSELGEWNDILPYDEFNGSISSLIGNLAVFFKQLRALRKKLIELQPLNVWVSCAGEIIESFFSLDINTKLIMNDLELQWKNILKFGLQANYTSSISITLIYEQLLYQLKKKSQRSLHYAVNAVHFCNFMSMNAMSFKIICLLGMNYDAYPRSQSVMSFNLMTKQPYYGDFNLNNSDRYLFLELLTTAKQFYISFIGYNVKNSSALDPSILVTELLDYISHNFYLSDENEKNINFDFESISKHLLRKHSYILYTKKNKLFTDNKITNDHSYYLNNTKIKFQNVFINDNIPVIIDNKICLNELIFFYAHPIRYWLQKQLSVFFYYKNITVKTEEPFVFDHVMCYKINKKIVEYILQKKDINILYKRVLCSGELPYGFFGKFCWEKQYEEMLLFTARFKLFYQPLYHDMSVLLNFNKFYISGILPKVQNNGLVRWFPKKISLKEGLQLWIEHLVYCAMGGAGDSWIFGLNTEWHFSSLSMDQAKLFLHTFISGYYEGMQYPLFLLYASGEAWLNHCFNKYTKEINFDEIIQYQAKKKITKIWYGNNFFFGENNDPYLKKIIYKLDENIISKIIDVTKRFLLFPYMYNQKK